MIYNIDYETLPRKALEKIQLRRLNATLERVKKAVPFYQKQFKKFGELKSIEELQELPFTTKEDLRNNYPFKMFATPMDNIVRIHSSSGTTGKPTVVAYTANDINTWSNLMARSLCAGGATPSDIVHNAYGYGLFTGGLGVHYGAEKLGASVIPVSGGNTKRQINIIQDFSPTILTATPSYTLHIADTAKELGFDLRNSKLKFGIFGAEPWSENMRNEIEEIVGITAVDIYGLSEVMGPGVAIECFEAKNGLHIFEDHFLPEIINPDTGEVLPYGEKGELVFTSLTKEAFPIIRYRTRDITSLNLEPCICGRTHIKMNKVSGRNDDMLIIRGVNVFPSQIEHILMQIENVEPHYQLVVDRKNNLDILEVQIEVGEKFIAQGDAIKHLQNIEKKISSEIKEFLGVSAKVKLVEPKTIVRSEGKASRVVDNRNL